MALQLGGTIYPQLSFSPTRVVIDNPGSFWINMPDMQGWCPPNTVGRVALWTTTLVTQLTTVPPSGFSNGIAPQQPASIIFTDNPNVPISPGVTQNASISTPGIPLATLHANVTGQLIPVPQGTVSLMVTSAAAGGPATLTIVGNGTGNTYGYGYSAAGNYTIVFPIDPDDTVLTVTTGAGGSGVEVLISAFPTLFSLPVPIVGTVGGVSVPVSMAAAPYPYPATVLAEGNFANGAIVLPALGGGRSYYISDIYADAPALDDAALIGAGMPVVFRVGEQCYATAVIQLYHNGYSIPVRMIGTVGIGYAASTVNQAANIYVFGYIL
jgi:hypothetical protein